MQQALSGTQWQVLTKEYPIQTTALRYSIRFQCLVSIQLCQYCQYFKTTYHVLYSASYSSREIKDNCIISQESLVTTFHVGDQMFLMFLKVLGNFLTKFGKNLESCLLLFFQLRLKVELEVRVCFIIYDKVLSQWRKGFLFVSLICLLIWKRYFFLFISIN